MYVGLVTLSFISITLPFYLYDPVGFSPLHTVGKLKQFESVLPHAGPLILAVCGMAALVLSLQRMDVSRFFRNCAIVQAIPVLFGMVLSLISMGAPGLVFSEYGLAFLFFGVGSFASFWGRQPVAIHSGIAAVDRDRHG
jgi:hypothetical protein